jgi:hypothetical protein
VVVEKVILTVQLLGIFFALDMIFITYYYHKRGIFEPQDSMLWTAIWIILLLSVTFPQRLEALAEPLQIIRVFDFLTVGAFFLSFGLVFITFVRLKSTEHQIQRIVREIALRDAEEED